MIFALFWNFARCIALDLCANVTTTLQRQGTEAAAKEQQPAEVKRSTIDCVLAAIRLAAAAVLFVAHNQLVSFYCQRRHRTTLRHRLVLGLVLPTRPFPLPPGLLPAPAPHLLHGCCRPCRLDTRLDSKAKLYLHSISANKIVFGCLSSAAPSSLDPRHSSTSSKPVGYFFPSLD